MKKLDCFLRFAEAKELRVPEPTGQVEVAFLRVAAAGALPHPAELDQNVSHGETPDRSSSC
jgi:hypothetical protein